MTATTCRASAACSASYGGIDQTALRANLVRFLKEVVPTAEEAGMRLCIHPDDPPRPLFGLSRIVSSNEDIAFVLDAVESPGEWPHALHRLARRRSGE